MVAVAPRVARKLAVALAAAQRVAVVVVAKRIVVVVVAIMEAAVVVDGQFRNLRDDGPTPNPAPIPTPKPSSSPTPMPTDDPTQRPTNDACDIDYYLDVAIVVSTGCYLSDDDCSVLREFISDLIAKTSNPDYVTMT